MTVEQGIHAQHICAKDKPGTLLHAGLPGHKQAAILVPTAVVMEAASAVAVAEAEAVKVVMEGAVNVAVTVEVVRSRCWMKTCVHRSHLLPLQRV
jgi:hypothetical protein